jgi:hypothetical protein
MATDISAPVTVTVFAYGSNMLTARLRERCPSAKPIGVAELRGYELRWHKRSIDGSGKCDVVQQGGVSVLGVLYEVLDTEKRALDKAEGLGQGYAETEVKVRSADGERTAVAYVATDLDATLKPFSWYHAFVLGGAREHGLEATYIDALAAVAVVQDPDRARHERNMRLLGVEAAR